MIYISEKINIKDHNSLTNQLLLDTGNKKKQKYVG